MVEIEKGNICPSCVISLVCEQCKEDRSYCKYHCENKFIPGRKWIMKGTGQLPLEWDPDAYRVADN